MESIFNGAQPTEDKKLVMEYVLRPVTTTSLQFLYRFKAPIATIWLDGAIPGTTKEPLEEALKKHGMKQYRDMVGNDGSFLADVMGGVELKECDIVRIDRKS